MIQVPIKRKIPVEKHPLYAPFCQALTGQIKAIEYFEREKELKLPVMVCILLRVSVLKPTLWSRTRVYKFCFRCSVFFNDHTLPKSKYSPVVHFMQRKLTKLAPLTSSKARAYVVKHSTALETEIECLQKQMSAENLESSKVAFLCQRLRGVALHLGRKRGKKTHKPRVEEPGEGQLTFADGSFLVRSLDSSTNQVPELRRGKLVHVGKANDKFVVSDAKGNIGKKYVLVGSFWTARTD